MFGPRLLLNSSFRALRLVGLIVLIFCTFVMISDCLIFFLGNLEKKCKKSQFENVPVLILLSNHSRHKCLVRLQTLKQYLWQDYQIEVVYATCSHLLFLTRRPRRISSRFDFSGVAFIPPQSGPGPLCIQIRSPKLPPCGTYPQGDVNGLSV